MIGRGIRRQPLQVLRKVRCRLLRYRLSLPSPRHLDAVIVPDRLRESLACCKAEVAATTKVLKITERLKLENGQLQHTCSMQNGLTEGLPGRTQEVAAKR